MLIAYLHELPKQLPDERHFDKISIDIRKTKHASINEDNPEEFGLS